MLCLCLCMVVLMRGFFVYSFLVCCCCCICCCLHWFCCKKQKNSAYIVMAVLGGMLGAAFNQIVEHLAHMRAEYINTHGSRRLLEVLFLTMLTGTIVVFLPMNAVCRPATRDVMLRDSAGCLPPGKTFWCLQTYQLFRRCCVPDKVQLSSFQFFQKTLPR